MSTGFENTTKFKQADHVIEINEGEQILIYGNLRKYVFEYYIYSEALVAWVPQFKNIESLKIAGAYDRLIPRIEKVLSLAEPEAFGRAVRSENYDKMENYNY